MNRRELLIVSFSTLVGSPLAAAAMRSDRRERTMSPSLVLQYSLEVVGGRLILTYNVLNQADHDAFVFTPLSTYSGGRFVPAPDRVYVFVRNSQVNLAKCLWPVPKDREVYMPEMPFLTRVQRQGRFQEKLQLRLPLVVDYPYREETSDTPVRFFESAVFSIGYIEAAQAVPGLEPVSGTDLYQVPYGEAITRQLLASADSVPLKLPLKG